MAVHVSKCLFRSHTACNPVPTNISALNDVSHINATTTATLCARGTLTQARERTAAEVKSEWLEGFDISGDVEGCATRSDFVKFYTHLSAAMGAAAANTHASTSSSNSDEAFAAIVRGTWGLGADVGADVAPWRVTFDASTDFSNLTNNNNNNSANASANDEHDHYHNGAGDDDDQSQQAQQQQQQQQQQQYSNNTTNGSSSNDNYTAAAAEQLNPRDAAIARAGAQGALPPPPAVHRAGVETGLAGYSGVRTSTTGTTTASAALRSTTSSGDGSLPFGLQAVVRKLRTAVTGSRGVRGIAALQRALRKADSDGDGRVILAEFKHALHTTLSNTSNTTNSGSVSGGSAGGDLSEAELRMLHAHFDADGCGSCATADIAAAVRVPLQHRRAACVRAAFSKLQHAAVAAAGAAGTGAYLTGLGLVDATAVVR
jgi:hypothetical protein